MNTYKNILQLNNKNNCKYNNIDKKNNRLILNYIKKHRYNKLKSKKANYN